VRLRGAIVRFYLPDVVRHLTATAVTRKHGRGAADPPSLGFGGQGVQGPWRAATIGSVVPRYPRRAE
jgi:hypothetical protein